MREGKQKEREWEREDTTKCNGYNLAKKKQLKISILQEELSG